MNTTEKNTQFSKLNLYYFTFLIEFSFNFHFDYSVYSVSILFFLFLVLVFFNFFIMVKWWTLKPKFNCVFFGIKTPAPITLFTTFIFKFCILWKWWDAFEGKSDWYMYADVNENGTGTGNGVIVEKKIIEFTRRKKRTPAVDGCTRVWGVEGNFESARQQTETNYIQQIFIFSNIFLASNFVFPHLNNYPSNMLFLCYEKHQDNYEEKSKIF